MTNVKLGHANLTATVRRTESGKPLVVFEGFPAQNEGMTKERALLLAERIYQALDMADRGKETITLEY